MKIKLAEWLGNPAWLHGFEPHLTANGGQITMAAMGAAGMAFIWKNPRAFFDPLAPLVSPAGRFLNFLGTPKLWGPALKDVGQFLRRQPPDEANKIRAALHDVRTTTTERDQADLE